MKKNLNIVGSYLPLLNTNANRTLVANKIVDDMFNDGCIKSNDISCGIGEYIFDYLYSEFNIEELIQLEYNELYVSVRERLINNFLKNYTSGNKEVETAFYVTCSDVINDWFDFETIDDLYNKYVVNEMSSATKFEEYVNEKIPNILPNYTFDIDVTFEVEPKANYDFDYIKSKIGRRIGKGAKYKWSACELVGIIVSQINDEPFKGKITLHINGNATYTIDTIKKAIQNRLGADAKRKVWNEFVICDIKSVA